jgi:membrane dipeptidase
VIEGIARTGGVFGVNVISTFLTWGYKDVKKDRIRDRPPVATMDRLLDEIDYLMRLVGPDHIGIGPDFVHGRGTFKVDPEKSFSFPIEMTYGEDGIEYVRGFEDISKIGNVRAGLASRNYSKENIDKILGGNWMRVYRDAWNA